jgi:hypothetical protein
VPAGAPDVPVGGKPAGDLVPQRAQVILDQAQGIGERGRLARVEADDDVEVVVVRDEGSVPHHGEDRSEPEADVGREGPDRLDDARAILDVVRPLGLAPAAERALRAMDGPLQAPGWQQAIVERRTEPAPELLVGHGGRGTCAHGRTHP